MVDLTQIPTPQSRKAIDQVLNIELNKADAVKLFSLHTKSQSDAKQVEALFTQGSAEKLPISKLNTAFLLQGKLDKMVSAADAFNFLNSDEMKDADLSAEARKTLASPEVEKAVKGLKKPPLPKFDQRAEHSPTTPASLGTFSSPLANNPSAKTPQQIG